MHNNTVLETETDLLGGVIPLEDFVSTCNSDSVADIPKENGKVNVGENEMQSPSTFLDQGTDVKGNEESIVDEILSDVAIAPRKTANEASEVACSLQEKDLKTSDSLSLHQIVEPKEEILGSTMSLQDLSPEVKSCEHVEVVAQIESYSTENGDIGSHSDLVDACEIGESGEVIEPAVDDNKDTVCKEKSSIFPSVKSGACFDVPSAELQVLEGNLKQEDEGKRVLAAEVPVEKEVDTSELKMMKLVMKPTLSGGKNESNIDKNKNEKCDTDGKESRELVKEELSTNIETTSVCVDDLCVSEADKTMNDLGDGNSEMMAVQDKLEMNSKMTIESASTPSDNNIVVGEMDKITKNLQEAESTTYFVHDSSEVGPDASHLGITAPARSDLQNWQGEDSEEAMKEPKSNSTIVALVESVDAVCKGVESNHDRGAEVSEKTAETPPERFPGELESTRKSSSTVADDSHCKDGGLGASGVSTENLQREGRENLTKPPIEDPAVDVSFDSNSQTDSLEGNWGSVSGAVFSTQSDAVAVVDAEALPSTVSEAPAELDKGNLQKPQGTSGGHHSCKSDVFEHPSFMTLVEHQDKVDQKAAASDIQNGRKKNEEIIAKVTNWSAGKQHAPLKSLLGEANLETKPKSPNPKQISFVTKQDENTTTVDSILGSEAPTDQVAKRETGKEWNSPARYPSDNKKEKGKVKGKPYWAPFLCCSSVN
ncbi:pentatricopeptide repeat (PPR) superfamily protein [Actinidia rufa]|uniref:Pentatricopeptide repeat (PPR) superfamily protein n=1 Tax=Actinidia rufa TaxID=165716 RepID=A0A7J0E5F3_9ERIC|nr:pentatricopeptide repeat (PPR) superfamily protein [Actinidia rufa]